MCIIKATAFVLWEPERAKMAAKPPIFANVLEYLLRFLFLFLTIESGVKIYSSIESDFLKIEKKLVPFQNNLKIKNRIPIYMKLYSPHG